MARLYTVRQFRADHPEAVKARRTDNNTIEAEYPDRREIVFHRTPVVTFYTGTGKIMLRSGGWETVTTKGRINAALPAPFGIVQIDFCWYLDIGIERGYTRAERLKGLIPFEEGMTIDLPCVLDGRREARVLNKEGVRIGGAE
jgi:hypothetical protein